MTRYVSPDVAAVQRLYGGDAGVPLYMSRRLADGFAERDPGVGVVLRNWHPGCAGLPDPFAMALGQEDFRLAVAREHGYDDWWTASHALASPSFEAGVEAMLAGDIPELRRLLRREPDLVTRRSHWGHRATMLIYLTANGVETYRQVVPDNVVEIARLLVDRGADPASPATVYGGSRTPLELLATSAHPRAAGVTEALTQVLVEAVDQFGGRDHRSTPRWLRNGPEQAQ